LGRKRQRFLKGEEYCAGFQFAGTEDAEFWDQTNPKICLRYLDNPPSQLAHTSKICIPEQDVGEEV